MNIQVDEYIDLTGRMPYKDWLSNIKDFRAKVRVALQVDKMELGLFGDSQPIGGGLSELRIHISAGYRVYYAKVSSTRYLLLCGGVKSTQNKDIKRAKNYWSEYQARGGST